MWVLTQITLQQPHKKIPVGESHCISTDKLTIWIWICFRITTQNFINIWLLLTYIAVVIPGAVHVASNTTSGLPSRADSIRPAVSRASRVARSVLQSAVFFAKSSLAWFISAKKNKKRGISLYTGWENFENMWIDFHSDWLYHNA